MGGINVVSTNPKMKNERENSTFSFIKLLCDTRIENICTMWTSKLQKSFVHWSRPTFHIVCKDEWRIKHMEKIALWKPKKRAFPPFSTCTQSDSLIASIQFKCSHLKASKGGNAFLSWHLSWNVFQKNISQN